jgi:hypothetical protein
VQMLANTSDLLASVLSTFCCNVNTKDLRCINVCQKYNSCTSFSGNLI